MPEEVDTVLIGEYRAGVMKRFKELFKASPAKTQGDYFELYNTDLKKNSYYDLVVNGLAKTLSAAKDVLKALEYDSYAIELMLVRSADYMDINNTTVYEPNSPILSSTISAQVPILLNELIGREADVAEVVSLLMSHRLVTLVGAGGVGKTRLSVAIGHEVLDSTTDDVRFVQLAEVSADDAPKIKAELDKVASAIVHELHIQEQPEQAILETLVNWVSSRSMLLIIDNCEHLIGGCAQIAQILLSRCPKLRILATSRSRLGLFEESIHSVPSLDYPLLGEPYSDKNPKVNLLEFSAVRLFVERAMATGVKGEYNESQMIDIADICRRLDGIPLAIEMAAARVRSMPIEQIHLRLSDRFNMLIGERTSAPRHQTLEKLIDWSYDLLGESEQALLRSMAVFAGGATLEAAENTHRDPGGGPVYNLLTSLADLSLVKYEERDNFERYCLLETIRIYAARKLVQSGEYEIVRARHLAYFQKLALDAEPHLIGPFQVEWLHRMDEEYDNMRGALDWCLSTAEPIYGLRLCGALKVVWQTQGLYGEGREWCERALRNIEGEEKCQERAIVLNVVSFLAWNQGDNAAARAYSAESLMLSKVIGCRREEAMALINMSNVDLTQGNYAAARSNISLAMAIFVEIGDRWGVAIALNNLGAADDYESDYSSALASHKESLSIKTEIGDRSGIASSLTNLGAVSYFQGDYVNARKYHTESLSVARELQDRKSIATSLSNLGLLASKDKEYVTAESFHEQSLAIEREIGARKGIAASLGNLGVLAYIQGDISSARTYFEESLPIQREIGDKVSIAATLNNLGELAREVGSLKTARSYLTESLEIKRGIVDRVGIVSTLEAFANMASAENDKARAVALLSAAENLRDTINFPMATPEREAFDTEIANLRRALRGEEFEAAWESGRAMGMDKAIEVALRDTEGRIS